MSASRDGHADSAALFVREGDAVVPTALAVGPWRRDALHGGAVAALLASAIDVPGRTPVRITVDLLAPVPTAPLRLLVTPADGGERVARQTISLLADGAEVAHAHCLAVRHQELRLPAEQVESPNPFDGVLVPDVTRTRPQTAEAVGWTCFDSHAISVRGLRSPDRPAHATCVYVNLLVPVVAGEPISPLARAVAAADYGSHHFGVRLPFDEWSYMNAELSVHLSRVPANSWIGLVSTGVMAPNGCGLSMARLFDVQGRLGQSAQSLVVESRSRVSTSGGTPS